MWWSVPVAPRHGQGRVSLSFPRPPWATCGLVSVALSNCFLSVSRRRHCITRQTRESTGCVRLMTVNTSVNDLSAAIIVHLGPWVTQDKWSRVVLRVGNMFFCKTKLNRYYEYQQRTSFFDAKESDGDFESRLGTASRFIVNCKANEFVGDVYSQHETSSSVVLWLHRIVGLCWVSSWNLFMNSSMIAMTDELEIPSFLRLFWMGAWS